MTFAIASLTLENGATLGIAPLPGRFNSGLADIASLVKWAPDLVISATEDDEMERHNVADLEGLLETAEISVARFPIRDFGIPHTNQDWTSLSARARTILDQRGRLLAHCYGGQGRSGMILLRLMIERGQNPQKALKTLRTIRPGAVETDAQFQWASAPSLLR